MRKHIKQNLIDIIKTMYEAHEVIKSNIESGDFDNAVALLSDCQNTAVDLGNLIEKTEGENTHTVALLEEYCEELYNSAVSISENENVSSYKVCKNIDKKLRAVENSVRSDIKVRLEVVFMPYKASMWDSLESVWKAADEDLECDAYVVPIPYYDRTPQGTFGEYHYEGNEFPEYVPITHYDAYDLEKRRPDVIYIHNPYDNNNFVTSVDPRFYSFVLKKYTDKLVYIPYFVLAEPDPDDEQTLENISNFIITTGVINADEVIVQSEAMKQVYVKILLRQYGDTVENRKMLDKKILGTGSPKFDKVANTKKEDVDVPEEWQKIIKKPNGENKKVIFYNTSLNALLQHNEKMIDKIRDVLRVFYENKDDVALLWRPHPLIKATIESMRPQLWEAYKEIVDKYVEGGWGIYDDTPDLNRAIAISDAYYGDGSSVLALFQKINKPVLLQDCYCNNAENTITAISECCVEIGEEIYAASYGFNGIIRFNIQNKSFDYLLPFPGYSFWENRLYSEVLQYDDMLVFIPSRASHIAVYYLKDNTIKMYDFITENIEYKFIGGVIYEDHIVMIPYMYTSFVKFYPQTGKIEYVLDVSNIIPNKTNKGPYFEYQYCYDKEKIYMSVINSNRLMIIDISTMKYILSEITQVKSSITGIHSVDNNLWMTEYNSGVVYRFDKTSNQCTSIDISNGRESINLNYECISYDKYIIILPIQSGEIKYIDRVTKFLEKLDFLTMICSSESLRFGTKWTQICGYFFFKNELYIFDNYNYDLYKILIMNDGLSIVYVCSLREKREKIIEIYNSFSDVKRVIKKLDDSEFETAFYRLKEYLCDIEDK